MVGKIKISKGNNADSRTATDTSKEALLRDTLKHKKDVRNCMNFLAYLLMERGSAHDYTKLKYFEEFYKDYKGNPKDFVRGTWYNKHITEEKHHMARFEHRDTNLLDIIEHVVDIVVAGKARSGSVDRDFDDITRGMLERAYDNTVDLIDKMTELE